MPDVGNKRQDQQRQCRHDAARQPLDAPIETVGVQHRDDDCGQRHAQSDAAEKQSHVALPACFGEARKDERRGVDEHEGARDAAQKAQQREERDRRDGRHQSCRDRA